MREPSIKSYIRDPLEKLPAERMRELQLERLRAGIARIVRHVPPMQCKLEALGIAAEKIDSIEDLRKLPFTTKQDLRDHYPFGLNAAPMSEIVRMHASSGTTGKPTVVTYTRKDVELWAELIARCFAAAGVGATDVVHNAYGYGLFTGGLGLHYGAERLGAAVIPISGGNPDRQLMIMRDLASTVLCCTPSYALLLAETAKDRGVDLESLALRVGLFGAEPWSERMRVEIEDHLGLVALNIYGLSEVIGPGVAMECPEKQGLHIFEDHFIPEIIDPSSGEPLPDGEEGELVLTCVTKEALPLIRYRTRDRTRLMRGPCGCGRTTVRMDRIVGRSDDMVVVRGVNVFPSQVESVLLQFDEVEPHYQLIVNRGVGELDRLRIRVEAQAEVLAAPGRLLDLERRLAQALRNGLGIHSDLEILGPKQIARSEGKAVRVLDERAL